jgi:hypothetical protein
MVPRSTGPLVEDEAMKPQDFYRGSAIGKVAAVLVGSIVLVSATAEADSRTAQGTSRRVAHETKRAERSSAKAEPKAPFIPPQLVAIEGLRDQPATTAASGKIDLPAPPSTSGADDGGRDGKDGKDTGASSSEAVLQRIMATLDNVPLLTELTIEGITIANANGSRSVNLTVLPTKMQGGNGIVARGRF